MKINLNGLTNLQTLSDGWQAQCPACALHHEDLNGKNHLKIYKNGAFNCAKHSGEKDHNRVIREFLINGKDGAELVDIEYIDPTPKLEAEKIYPEEILSKLLKDYSYWEGRGIKLDVLTKIGGGVAPMDGERNKLSGRYIFPIRNLDGKIIGFSGRMLVGNSLAPKWKHMFKSSKACWPYHITKPYIQKTKTVVLVESIGDFLALANQGIWNVLVLFGLKVNSKIISALVSSSVEKIIISTNNDSNKTSNWGQIAADRARRVLSNYFDEEKVIIRSPNTGGDWGEADTAEILEFKDEIK